jgi:hypothetical protein
MVDFAKTQLGEEYIFSICNIVTLPMWVMAFTRLAVDLVDWSRQNKQIYHVSKAMSLHSIK